MLRIVDSLKTRGFDILILFKLNFPNFMIEIQIMLLESLDSGQHYILNFFVSYTMISRDSPLIYWDLSVSTFYIIHILQLASEFIFLIEKEK